MEEQYGQNQSYEQNLVYGQQQYQQQNQMYGQQQNQMYGQQPYQQQNQMYGQQPYQQQNPYYAQPARAVVYDTMPMKHNNMAISGLVFGIFAMISFWIPWVCIALAIIGIICSAIGLSKKDSHKGMAFAGLTLSIFALVLGIVMFFLYIVFS